MTAAQVNLVKKSWRMLRLLPPEVVAGTFYSKLFLDHSELRRMFSSDMGGQYEKLMAMLTAMVARLDDLDTFRPEINAMGQRHTNYGVHPQHYDMVGVALLWTLEKGLGDEWNEELAEAWRAAYGIIADAMLS